MQLNILGSVFLHNCGMKVIFGMLFLHTVSIQRIQRLLFNARDEITSIFPYFPVNFEEEVLTGPAFSSYNPLLREL